jgi:hypothetical protein
MIERGPNDIDLGLVDKGWVLQVSGIGYSDVDLGPSDRRQVT